MVFAVLLLVVGLGVLIKSAGWFVDGASSLALRFKISPIVIGLTVVAFGTSSPELVVSVTSALSGNTGVAFGNVIGSNIANILLILGIAAIITPIAVQRNTVWKEIPMSFLGAVVMTILGMQIILDTNTIHSLSFTSMETIGTLSFSNGLILLAFFIIFLYYTFGIAKSTSSVTPNIEKRTTKVTFMLIAFGMVGLIVGSRLFVDNAIIIARSFGVSDTFIGLTIVAIGTSLPELVTSIVAALKKQVELAVGNVIGSNIFNIFFILGVTALIKTIPMSGKDLVDIFVLFVATFVLFMTLFVNQKRCVTRAEGVIMLCGYIVYLSFLIVRG